MIVKALTTYKKPISNLFEHKNSNLFKVYIKESFLKDLVCFLPSWVFLNHNEYAYLCKLLRILYFPRVSNIVTKFFDTLKKRKWLTQGSSETASSISVYTIVISIILHNLGCFYLW